MSEWQRLKPYLIVRINLLTITVLASACLSAERLTVAGDFVPDRSNVLFIICDDLNDWILRPPGHPEVKSPHMDRLRERSVSFANAHAVVPVCGASRKTLFSGLYPQTIDDYAFASWNDVPALENVIPIPQHFRNNGYASFGAGKLLHEGAGGDFYTEWGVDRDYGPWPWRGEGAIKHTPSPSQYERWKDVLPIPMHRDLNYGPLSGIPEWEPNAIAGIPGANGWFYETGEVFDYVDADNRDLMPDEMTAEWAVEVLSRSHEKPFFIGLGFVRPHTPLYVPKKYFDLFPLEDITLPPYLSNDLEDCASILTERWRWGHDKFTALIEAEGEKGWKEWVQAYAASVAFVDDQIGKVLSALEASPYHENTIVVLTSDHGYHVGEKDTIQKWHLWDESTRVPLFIHVPRMHSKGQAVTHPVTLLDVYPTLVDLCDLPRRPNGVKLDGHSLVPFLEDPQSGTWTGPPVALMAVDDAGKYMLNRPKSGVREIQRHFSVRSRRYRYTLCANGEEELYDHQSDPHEWRNLAALPEYATIKRNLKEEMMAIFVETDLPRNFNPR